MREKIQRDGEQELERKRSAALEELDDAELRLHTGKYATPAFMAPELAAFPELVFRDDDSLKGTAQTPAAPKVPDEPWSMTKVVNDIRSPRREPVRWKRWAVRGGIAAVILITAGTAVMVESRSPVRADTLRAPARPTRPVAAVPAPAAPAVTDSSAGGIGVATDSASVGATDSSIVSAPDSLSAEAPIVFDSARAQARRDSVRRYNMLAAAARARADSIAQRREEAAAQRREEAAAERREEAAAQRRAESSERREGVPEIRRPIRTADPQDLMMLSDSLATPRSDTAVPEPPTVPQPNAVP